MFNVLFMFKCFDTLCSEEIFSFNYKLKTENEMNIHSKTLQLILSK